MGVQLMSTYINMVGGGGGKGGSGFHYRDTLALTDYILPQKACILVVYYEHHTLIITRTNLMGSDVTTVKSKSLYLVVR